MKINLLKDHRVLSEKDYLREQTILRYSVVALIVVVVILVAAFFWNFILSQKLSGIEASIKTSSQELQGLTEANAQQLYVKGRLKLISGFLAESSVAREALQQVLAVNVPGISIGGITFINDSELSVTIQANSADALGQTLSYYKADNGFFPQVVTKSITRQKDGKYELALILTIPKNKE